MQLIIAICNAKLKGDRLQEEGKTTTKSELGAWGPGDPGKHYCCTEAVNQTITRGKRAPPTTTLPRHTHPYEPWYNGWVTKPMGPCSGTLDKRGRELRLQPCSVEDGPLP